MMLETSHSVLIYDLFSMSLTFGSLIKDLLASRKILLRIPRDANTTDVAPLPDINMYLSYLRLHVHKVVRVTALTKLEAFSDIIARNSKFS